MTGTSNCQGITTTTTNIITSSGGYPLVVVYSGESTGGGGGGGGAGTSGSGSGAGNGGGITVSNYGPYNGTFGAGGGGYQTGSLQIMVMVVLRRLVMEPTLMVPQTGYANGGGGESGGGAGGSATAGIFLMRTPDAVTITLSSGTQTSGSGYKYGILVMAPSVMVGPLI